MMFILIRNAGDFSNKTISHKMINILWLIAAFILIDCLRKFY